MLNFSVIEKIDLDIGKSNHTNVKTFRLSKFQVNQITFARSNLHMKVNFMGGGGAIPKKLETFTWCNFWSKYTFFKVGNLVLIYVLDKRVAPKNDSHFDKIKIRFINLKVEGPNKDNFVNLTFTYNEWSLRIKINQISPIESCTFMLLKYRIFLWPIWICHD